MTTAPTRPRVLVVGCGAMGAIFAARLSGVAEVVAYDTEPAHVAAIRTHGLRVEGVSERPVRLQATDRPEDLAGLPFDHVLLLVKSAQTGAAARALLPHVGTRPLWVTLQNGMGNSEQLLALPGMRVARGVCMAAGRVLGPGAVEQLVQGGGSWLGPVNAGLDECAALAALLTAGGMPTQALADPMGAVWAKFVFNCVMNPVGALLLGVNAARYEVAEVRALIDEMAQECSNVVRALGGRFAFDPMDYVHRVRAGEAPLSRHCGSMALDIQRGVPTEIDELTGFVVREAQRLGVAVPACRTVYRLVKGLEHARAHQPAE